jgi:hypothetical protein
MQTVYLVVGSTCEAERFGDQNSLIDIESKKENVLLLIDDRLVKVTNCTMGPNVKSIEISREDEIESVFHLLGDIKNLVIIPTISNKELNSIQPMKELMDGLFLITKAFYREVLHKKGLRIWFLTCREDDLVEELAKERIACINEGIVAISRVLGNELAKRKIIVNTIVCTKQFEWDKLDKFLLNSRESQLLMNLESIKL